MIEPDDPQDRALSALYKAAATEQPPTGLDARILAAARATASPPRPRTGSALSRWRIPFALAATVLLTSTLTLMVREHDADPSSVSDGTARTKRSERTEPAEHAKPATPPTQAAPPAIPAPPDRPAPAAEAPREAKIAPITPQSAPRDAAPAPLQAEKTVDQPTTAKDEAAAPALSQSAGRIADERKAMRAAPQASRAESAESAGRADGAGSADRGAAAGSAGAAAGAAREIERSPVQWLAEIRKLRAEGKFDEAAAQLMAFRKRHPEYPLPEDLRQP